MSRYCIAVFLAAAFGMMAPRYALSASPPAAAVVDDRDDAPPLPIHLGETWHADWLHESPPPDVGHPAPLDAYEQGYEYDGPTETPWRHWSPLRHSSTHGRHIGRGSPLVGTSWRNRPYYVGGDLGSVWLTRPINEELDRDIDFIGGIFAGCDWDHYWGSELAIHWASPDLAHRDAVDQRSGRLTLWTASLLYYPWGDARPRPYWRGGVGATDLTFATADRRREETLWTIPVGVGIKYPLRRWLAARAELADHIGVGTGGVATQHNVSFTLGLEWRFGAHPRSYWPWNPNRHIW